MVSLCRNQTEDNDRMNLRQIWGIIVIITAVVTQLQTYKVSFWWYLFAILGMWIGIEIYAKGYHLEKMKQ